MYIENRNLRGVQKFVETSVVRRNSIGRDLVSANSCTPPKENYMLHLTRNESYTFWDEHEVRKGQYFIKFDKSRMLDMLDTLIIHTEDHSWPGVEKHFGIYACDHVIDVISAMTLLLKKCSNFAVEQKLHDNAKKNVKIINLNKLFYT